MDRMFALLVVLGVVSLSHATGAAEPTVAAPVPAHGRTYEIAGLPQHDFTLDATYEHGTLVPLSCAGTTAFIIRPKGEVDAARRWVWISNLFLATHYNKRKDVAHRHYVESLLERGFHIAGIDVGASCGSPAGADVYEAFYRLMTTEYGLNAKARMIGQSNGGLISYGFAFRHPDKVDRVLGICPATDLRSWPGLERVCGRMVPEGLSYGLKPGELEVRLAEFNPIDNLAPLAKAGVKVHHIHGAHDDIVPLEPNSGEFARRYRALGGKIEVEVVENGTHGGPNAAFFESERALQFLLE